MCVIVCMCTRACVCACVGVYVVLFQVWTVDESHPGRSLVVTHLKTELTLVQTPCPVLNSSQTCSHTLSSSRNQQATSCTSGSNAVRAGRLRKTRCPVGLQIQRNERLRQGMKRGIMQRVGLWSRWSRQRTPSRALAATWTGKRRM